MNNISWSFFIFIFFISINLVTAQTLNVEAKYVGKNMNVGAEKHRDMYEYTFNVHKGWNLVPPVWYSRGDIGCGSGFDIIENPDGTSRSIPAPENQHLKYAFIWTPTKGYVGGALDDVHTLDLNNFDEEEKKYIQQAFYGISDNENVFISTFATWVYSDADCSLKANQLEMNTRYDTSISAQENSDKELSKIKLQSGWNIVTILPRMFKNDKLQAYFKSCNVEKIASWNSETQEWVFPNESEFYNSSILEFPELIPSREVTLRKSEVITPQFYYRTLIVYTSDECSLTYNPAEENSYNPNPSSECIQVVNNGNSFRNIDLVFVGENYPDLNLLLNHTNQSINSEIGKKGLFSVEPLKSNIDYFNVWVVNRTSINGCEDAEGTSISGECKDNVKNEANKCGGNDLTIFLINKRDVNSASGAMASYDDSMIFSSTILGRVDNAGFKPGVITHEFGHAFVNLGDEYENARVTQDFSNRPNVDTEGCSKWCSGILNEQAFCYNDYIQFRDCLYGVTNNLTISYQEGCRYPEISQGENQCDLGTNCISGTGCYFNAKSLISFKPTPTSYNGSIMSCSDDCDNFEFNIPSQQAILKKINLLIYGNTEGLSGAPKKDKCTDSDGGKNYEEKGFTEGYTKDRVYASTYDSCYGNILQEWYCEGNFISNKWENHACDGICQDGACLSST